MSTSTTATWAPKGYVALLATKRDDTSSSTARSGAVGAASSAHETATAGVPATCSAPLADDDVGGGSASSTSPAVIWRAEQLTLAWCTAAPPCCSPREPYVPPPIGIRSVSPCSTVTSDIATPSTSEASIANAVS